MVHVDPFVHGDTAIRRHAVSDEHLTDGFGGGDEAVDLTLLPPRKGIAAKVEIHTAGGNQRGRAAARPRRGCGAHR